VDVAGVSLGVERAASRRRLAIAAFDDEFTHSTGLAACVDAASNPVKPPGWPFTERDFLCYRWRGDALLAAEDHAGSHPRLHRAGKLVWSSDTANAVTFWPMKRR
jgi:hypothetical protein